MNTGSDALLGIHHAALICSDYARSKDFYVRILGLRVLAENHRAARDSWKLDLALPDGGQLELFSFPRHRPAPAARRPRACATSRSGSLRWSRSSNAWPATAWTANRSAWTNTPAAASPSSPTPTACRWNCTKSVDGPGQIPSDGKGSDPIAATGNVIHAWIYRVDQGRHLPTAEGICQRWGGVGGQDRWRHGWRHRAPRVRALCLRSTASQAPERPAASGWAGPRSGVYGVSCPPTPPRHPTESRR